MDLIQKCIKEKTVIYSFVIPDKLVDEFVKAVQEESTSESKVLVSLVREWLSTHRTG